MSDEVAASTHDFFYSNDTNISSLCQEKRDSATVALSLFLDLDNN